MNIILPTYLKEFTPKKPIYGVYYGFECNDFTATIVNEPIVEDEYYTKEHIVESFNSESQEKHGLLEIEEGETKRGIKFIWFLAKEIKKPEGTGVVYFARFQLLNGDDSNELSIYFDEIGMTGFRDSMIFAKLGMKNMESWTFNPFRPENKKCFLMNLSEDRKYDCMFPNHPLTKIRELIQFLVENN